MSILYHFTSQNYALHGVLHLTAWFFILTFLVYISSSVDEKTTAVKMKHILIFQDFLQTLFFVIKYFMYSTGTVFV